MGGVLIAAIAAGLGLAAIGAQIIAQYQLIATLLIVVGGMITVVATLSAIRIAREEERRDLRREYWDRFGQPISELRQYLDAAIRPFYAAAELPCWLGNWRHWAAGPWTFSADFDDLLEGKTPISEENLPLIPFARFLVVDQQMDYPQESTHIPDFNRFTAVWRSMVEYLEDLGHRGDTVPALAQYLDEMKVLVALALADQFGRDRQTSIEDRRLTWLREAYPHRPLQTHGR